jgi:hypothetical protein
VLREDSKKSISCAFRARVHRHSDESLPLLSSVSDLPLNQLYAGALVCIIDQVREPVTERSVTFSSGELDDNTQLVAGCGCRCC